MVNHQSHACSRASIGAAGIASASVILYETGGIHDTAIIIGIVGVSAILRIRGEDPHTLYPDRGSSPDM